MKIVNEECHKGSFCAYVPIFCQEEYCPGCEIYLKQRSPAKLVDSIVRLTLQEVANSRPASNF
jgi:hypothetical protein